MSWLISCPVARAAAPETRAELEQIAGQLKFFATQDFIANRHEIYQITGADAGAYQTLMGALTARRHEPKSLVVLLEHKDPRVRTLALAALFAKEDPKLLPQFVKLVDDPAETFPRLQFLGNAFPKQGELPPFEKQTVGELARLFLQTYLSRAGYYYWPEGRGGNPGFEQYWALRKDRAFCASWFGVQFFRACGGTSPTPENRVAAVKEVRRRIDQLPQADRTWTLLWLHDEPGADALVTEEELVAFCKQLGPERLLLMLQRKIPSDDPDVQARYRRMSVFVLRRAKELLRPEDLDSLLACERWERDYVKHGISDPSLTPWWAIAAADLQPAKAKQILHDAFERFQEQYRQDERTDLALALGRLVGPAEEEFLVKWFYAETPQIGHIYHCRAKFVWGTARRGKPEDRKLIAALVRAKEFDSLDWQALQVLVEVVNNWTKPPIVDSEAIERTWHPYGISHFHWWQARARREYPKETEELLKTLSQWRAAVRESIPRWSK